MIFIELSTINNENDYIKLIRELFPKLSNSVLKKYLDKKFIQKQNQNIKSNRDILIPINLVNEHLISPIYQNHDLPKFLGEQNEIYAFYKPYRCHSHPLSYDESDNLLSFLRQEGFVYLLNVNKEQKDRGLIYRLDYETSGLILLTSSEEKYKDFRQSFHKMVKHKEYLAIVSGYFNDEGEKVCFAKSSGVKGHKMQAFSNEEVNSQKIINEFKLINYNEKDDLSLIKIIIKTGVRHQIRTHLNFLGFPILGDELYQGKKESRLYLHCYKYQLINDNNMLSFTSKELILFDKFFNLNCVFNMT